MELKNIIGKFEAVSTKLKLTFWLYIILVLPINRVETRVCNCVQNKCNYDGSCQPTYRCKEKFFGYYCEYNDLNTNHRNRISQLGDENYMTCAEVGEEFGTDYGKNRIYMIQLIVKDSSEFKNISVIFKDWSRERACNGHVVTPEETIVEYYCGNLDFSNGLTIHGLAGKEICHVHVTNGRNMAAGGSVITGAKAFDTSLYSKDGLIDGNRLPDKLSCFLSQRYNDEFSIDIYLRMGSLVNFVEIVDSYRLTQPIAGTRIEFIDDSRKTLRSLTLLVSPWKAYYQMLGKPVWRVSLYKRGQFGACEIEVRGDCAMGKYGHDCKSICKPRCKDSRCTSKGICITCRDSLIPPRCCKQFCNPYRDCGDDGSCINGCVKKKFGLDCSKDCNANCAGDGSCDSNGRCLGGCKYGFFGRSCSLSCSDSCARDKRCHMNGTCVFGCIPKFYGHECGRKCNRNCAGLGDCNIQGHCISGCKVGFYGPNCSQVCKSNCPKNKPCDETGSCSKPCSEHCSNDGTCHQNGTCVHGCLAKSYGPDCSRTCSVNCAKDGACDKDGSCIYGCHAMFHTLTCTEKCDPPHFGVYCNQTCPVTCLNRTCDYHGHCTSKTSGDDEFRLSQSYAERLTSLTFIDISTTVIFFVVLTFL